jgi:hypothetical protein
MVKTAESAVCGLIFFLVERGVPPHPRVFLTKSAETLENKRVEFSGSAKKCKRVRKSVKGKELVTGDRSPVTDVWSW